MPNADIWTPNAAAIVRIPDARTRDIVALRHPTYPFEDTWHTDDPEDLKVIVAKYLRKVRTIFGFGELFDPKDPTRFAVDVPLAWLPLAEGQSALPLESLWINRRDGRDAGAAILDRTAVFFALQTATPNAVNRVLGSRHGIRIVVHVPGTPRPRTVRITLSSCSPGLRRMLEEFLVEKTYAPAVTAFFEEVFRTGGLAPALKDALRAAANAEEVFVNGIRVVGTAGDRALVDVFATVPRRDDDVAARALSARVSAAVAGAGKLDVRVSDVQLSPLVADATQAALFLQDPASEAGLGHIVDARPNRSPIELDAFRHPVTLPGLTPTATEVVLHDDQDQVKVMQSKLVDEAADESQAERVPLPIDLPHARMNRFAALSAYRNARGLFDTIRGYGLTPAEFFRHAAPPVRIRYRAPMTKGPGRDGRIVNAEVDFDPPRYDWIGAVKPQRSALDPLQVRFGLADLKRSDSRRQPLGLAADPRWSWHEYCHVLLAASTGALELPFVHSAGDALAAILSDPLSKLQDTPWIERRWHRGITFPWVYLSRRHDRSVFEGWSWTGTHHRPVRFPHDADTSRRKGYLSEQILSTTLFRVYRALGGDTLDPATDRPDPVARQAAASYTAYLILRAILALGAQPLLPSLTPEDLLSALIDADVATAPASTGPLKDRVGGCAHKVLSWAFEAQGLDATVPLADVADTPGNPPAVDVFIDSGRRDAEGRVTRGGYVPVSLAWKPEPDGWTWQAPAAITVSNRKVMVHVRNRGRQDATGVHVRVRWTIWPDFWPLPPKWNEPGRWKLLSQQPAKTVPAWPHPGVDFGPFGDLPPFPARYLILAEASGPADLSNIANTGLPCATEQTPIVDLVAGDNNLGLIMWRWP